jgi:hypothetical protein
VALTSMGILSKCNVQSCALTIILLYFIFVLNERPTSQRTIVVSVLSGS